MFGNSDSSQHLNELNTSSSTPLNMTHSEWARAGVAYGLANLQQQPFRSSSSFDLFSDEGLNLTAFSRSANHIPDAIEPGEVADLIGNSVRRIHEQYHLGFQSFSQTQNSDGSEIEQPLVGIIDTGFSEDNPNSHRPNVTLGRDLVDRDSNPLTDKGTGREHGDQILNTISAKDGDASLWLGRAVGSGKWAESLIEFVDAAKASGEKNAIANLSFDLTQVNPDGSLTTRTQLTDEERAALKYAHDNGIIIVAAAGNTGEQMSALGQASQEFDNIITVGAAKGGDRANYSSYGKGLTLLVDGSAEDGSMAEGTSIAAAKVSADVAQVWETNSDLNYHQVIDILKSTATDMKTAGWDLETGAGLINVEAALTKAETVTPDRVETVKGNTNPERNLLADTIFSADAAITSERPAGLWDKLKRAAKVVTQPVVNVVETVVEPIVEHVVEPVVETVVEPVVEHVVEPVVEHVVEPVVEHVIEPVVEYVVEPVGEFVWDAAQNLGEGVWDVTEDIGEGIWDVTEDLGEGIWEATKNLGEGTWDVTKELGEGIWDTTKNLGEGVWDMSKDLGEGAWDTTKSLGEGAWDTTKNLGEGVWEVTKDLSQGHIADAIEEAGKTAIDLAKDVGKTALNVAKDVGETAVEAVKDKFAIGFNFVKDGFHTTGRVLTDIIHTTEQVSGTILDTTEKVVEGAVRTGVDVVQDVGDTAGEILEPVTPDFIKSAVDWTDDHIVKPVEDVTEKVWEGAKWFTDQTRDKTFGIFHRTAHWVEKFPDRLERLGEDIVSGKNERLGKEHSRKNPGDWLENVAIDLGDLIGLGEAYETGADLVKFNTRKLTDQEIEIARSVFGDSINYDLVRIDKGAVFGSSWTNRPYTSFHTINSWGNLGDNPTDERATLIHELTHVWQYQQDGSIYMPDALVSQKKPGLTPGMETDGYDYGGAAMLNSHKNDELAWFNYEAQAHIIEDYYKLKYESNTLVDTNSDGIKELWATDKKGNSYLVATESDLPIYAHFVDEVSTKSEDELK